MQDLKRGKRLFIQFLVLAFFFLMAVLSFLPTLFSYLLLIKLEFSTLMFYSGLIMGLFYNVLEFGNFLYQRKKKQTRSWAYFWQILPASFLLTGFSWYFIIMANKMLAENKEDAEFFQAVMIAFTVFFLIVKVGKEIKNLYAAYQGK